MRKALIFSSILLLGVLFLSGIVFSLDKVAKAEEETYDTCISFCGVKYDRVNCVRGCERDHKSCIMGCGCWGEGASKCATTCNEGRLACVDACYEGYDSMSVKDNPWTGVMAWWWPEFEFWESECDAGAITRPFDYDGCVEECKEYFLVKEPAGKKDPSATVPSGVSEEEPTVTVMKKAKAFFATSTGITGTISRIVGPIILFVIVGIVIYFLLKKKKTSKV